MNRLGKRMKATGIGFAGIDGAWWLPASAPIHLPSQSALDLHSIGQAIFALCDVVQSLFATPLGESSGLNHLLTHKVPSPLLTYTDPSPVLSLRPDFQIVAQHESQFATRNSQFRLQFVATELEICPSAQGYAHAMQVGYDLPTDLADAFAKVLNGRKLIFVGTEQWSEFIFEQLAFCRALSEHGGEGLVIYDLPIKTLAQSIRKGDRWQPPIFGVKQKPPGWDDDLLGRVERSGLSRFLHIDDDWPESVGDALVFRFGYLECFSADHLAHLARWQANGATFLNPLSFVWENKSVMAALHLPIVRQRIAERAAQLLNTLDRCIPETRLLIQSPFIPQLLAEKDNWILKFAGFDASNQAWGGRCLQIGRQHSAESWATIVRQYIDLPFPTVAQRFTPSLVLDIDYLDSQDQPQTLIGGTTRLRTFFLRSDKDAALACGSHITLSGATIQVSEATDAVQAPVFFSGV